MHIFSSNGYHIAVCHRGVKISADISSFSIYLKIFGIRQSGGKCIEGMFSNFGVEHPLLLNSSQFHHFAYFSKNY